MIKLVVDSTCDIPSHLVEKYNIRMLPITVEINGVEYKDKIDLNAEEFYEKINEKGVLPKTAQANPSAFETVFKEELEKGNKVICVTISSELSGTYNSANIAKNMLSSKDIHIIDSRSASFGFGMIVVEIAKLINDGKKIGEVLDKAKYLVRNQGTLAYVDTLEMLKRSGRLSQASAIVGNLIGIKPILTIDNGSIIPIGKARGKKAALRQITEMLKEEDIDEEVGLYFAHSNMESGCQVDIDFLKNNGINFNYKESVVGAAVGTHLGAGAFVVFFVRKS